MVPVVASVENNWEQGKIKIYAFLFISPLLSALQKKKVTEFVASALSQALC